MKYLALALLLGGLSTYQATAQQITPPVASPGGRLWANENLGALLDGKMAYAYQAPQREAQGQAFFQRTWQPGEIILVNTKQRIGNIQLQYDAYGYQLLAVPQRNRADTLLLNKNEIQGFVVQDELFADRVHTFRRFDNAPRPDQQQEYVEVLHEGKYTLLKRHSRQLQRSDKDKVFNSGRHYDQLVEYNSYFLSRPDGTVVPVKLNAKAISAAAPDLAAAIKAELARQQVLAKSELDIVTLLASVDKAP
ncbi:hypothetical protein [Hymenobacter sp. DG01]|uniref:hypothetical protein n=1 Tax=Hymenobacter sp. DG01 TaxID=2584940 RepID=UPI001120735F|nr:hypothetical protein [Hymenobacter sp. DG01]